MHALPVNPNMHTFTRVVIAAKMIASVTATSVRSNSVVTDLSTSTDILTAFINIYDIVLKVAMVCEYED